jgi:tRNA threonylcarbamoyladenosine modification (KEOPS) complex Cgi121 subunit
MLDYIEEHYEYVQITGFRGAKIADAKTFLETVRKSLPCDSEIQLFDADLIATWQHLYFAVINALTAFKTKRNLSNSVAVEAALYASGQRQITKAIAQIGVTPHTNNVAVIILSTNAGVAKAFLETLSAKLNMLPDESVLELTEGKAKRLKQVFDISELELEAVSPSGYTEKALVDLIIERVALLTTRL